MRFDTEGASRERTSCESYGSARIALSSVLWTMGGVKAMKTKHIAGVSMIPKRLSVMELTAKMHRVTEKNPKYSVEM